MIYYVLLWVAVVIGQLFFATAAVWYWQRSNNNIDYITALKLYFKKEVGTYILVLSATMLLTFILPDWFNIKMTKADLLAKSEITRFEYWQIRFRTGATIYGTFAHLIALIFYKGGMKAVKDFGKNHGA